MILIGGSYPVRALRSQHACRNVRVKFYFLLLSEKVGIIYKKEKNSVTPAEKKLIMFQVII